MKNLWIVAFFLGVVVGVASIATDLFNVSSSRAKIRFLAIDECASMVITTLAEVDTLSLEQIALDVDLRAFPGVSGIFELSSTAMTTDELMKWARGAIFRCYPTSSTEVAWPNSLLYSHVEAKVSESGMGGLARAVIQNGTIKIFYPNAEFRKDAHELNQ